MLAEGVLWTLPQQCVQGGKLHCTGPDVLPNGYNVAVEDGSVDRYRITRVRARVSTGFLA